MDAKIEDQAIIDKIAADFASIRRARLNALADATQALFECEDYFDGRADADCEGDPLQFVPNEEMRLLQTVREALAGLKAAYTTASESKACLFVDRELPS